MITAEKHPEEHHDLETNVGLNERSLWRPKMSKRTRGWQNMLQESLLEHIHYPQQVDALAQTDTQGLTPASEEG